MTEKEYNAIQETLKRLGTEILYNFEYNEKLNISNIKYIQENNLNFEEFEEYYMNDIIYNDLSFIEYENDIIFDYIEYTMNLLNYKTTEEFENIDGIIEYLKDKLEFKYNLKKLLENSNITL